MIWNVSICSINLFVVDNLIILREIKGSIWPLRDRYVTRDNAFLITNHMLKKKTALLSILVGWSAIQTNHNAMTLDVFRREWNRTFMIREDNMIYLTQLSFTCDTSYKFT